MSAMSGDPDEMAEIGHETPGSQPKSETQAAPKSKRIVESPFVSSFSESDEPAPEPEAPRKRQPEPTQRQQAPAFNLAEYENNHRKTVDAFIGNSVQASLMAIGTELQNLPNPDTLTLEQAEQLGPVALAKALARREVLLEKLNTGIRDSAQQQRAVMNGVVGNTVAAAGNALERFGEMGPEIVRMVSGMGLEQQANPQTYEQVADLLAGQKMRLERESKQRSREVADRMASPGRSSSGSRQATAPVTSEERAKLKAFFGGLGKKGERGYAETVARLERQTS